MQSLRSCNLKSANTSLDGRPARCCRTGASKSVQTRPSRTFKTDGQTAQCYQRMWEQAHMHKNMTCTNMPHRDTDLACRQDVDTQTRYTRSHTHTDKQDTKRGAQRTITETYSTQKRLGILIQATVIHYVTMYYTPRQQTQKYWDDTGQKQLVLPSKWAQTGRRVRRKTILPPSFHQANGLHNTDT